MEKDIKVLVDQFREDGYISPISIFSQQEITQTEVGFSEFEKNMDIAREDYENLHFYAEWARKLVAHNKLLDLIEAILGPEILVYGSLILSKKPGTFSHLSWHQDQYFFPEKAKNPYITAWIALTQTTASNGCMKVIPKSHKKGILPHLPFVKDDTNLLTKGEEIKISPKENEIENIILLPGQISLHDGALVHSSSANLTNENRVGFIVRYLTPDISKTNNPVLQVRGAKDISHLKKWNKKPMLKVSDAVEAYQSKGNK